MTQSTIFSLAHKQAAYIRKRFVSYRAAFKHALKFVYEQKAELLEKGKDALFAEFKAEFNERIAPNSIMNAVRWGAKKIEVCTAFFRFTVGLSVFECNDGFQEISVDYFEDKHFNFEHKPILEMTESETLSIKNKLISETHQGIAGANAANYAKFRGFKQTDLF